MTRSRTLCASLCAIASVLPAVLVAQSLPFHQRVGLWLIDMTMLGKPHPGKECISEESLAFQKRISEEVRKRNACSAAQIAHNPDGSWTESYTCTFADGKRTTTRSTFRGDFNSKFTATVAANQGAPTTSVFTYVGPCPAGMHGGDVEMDGHIANTMTMFKH